MLQVPVSHNEPVLNYAPGTGVRSELENALRELASRTIETPLEIGGRRVYTGNTGRTVILSQDPHHRLMEEQMFGPVLTVYAYPESQFEDTLNLCDSTSPYGLTGSIWVQDRRACRQRPLHSATPPATFVSTTSQPAPSSDCSPSEVAPQAPTTRPAAR